MWTNEEWWENCAQQLLTNLSFCWRVWRQLKWCLSLHPEDAAAAGGWRWVTGELPRERASPAGDGDLDLGGRHGGVERVEVPDGRHGWAPSSRIRSLLLLTAAGSCCLVPDHGAALSAAAAARFSPRPRVRFSHPPERGWGGGGAAAAAADGRWSAAEGWEAYLRMERLSFMEREGEGEKVREREIARGRGSERVSFSPSIARWRQRPPRAPQLSATYSHIFAILASFPILIFTVSF